jgi:hypothetical protein
MKTKSLPESRQLAVMLGYLCVATEPDATLDRKVKVLDRFGLTDDEIAIICDCKSQSIRNSRQKLKRKK